MVADVAVPTWAAWTVGVTAVCTAIAALAGGGRIVLSVVRWVAAVEEAIPVLLDLARNYGDEHGGEALTAELAGLARMSAENQRLMNAKLDAHAAKLDAQTAKLDELHTYSHAMKHDIIGDVGVLAAAFGSTKTIVEAIAEAANELKAVRQALLNPREGEQP